MRVLGIDTSTKYAVVAVVEDFKILAQSSLQFMAAHSEKLLPEIVHLLEIMKIPLETIDYYAVTVGPGSFTGLRVGVSTVKGLAFVTGKSVIPLSSLEVLARGFPFIEHQICPILDARKKELYSAIFKWEGRELKRLKQDSVLPISDLVQWIDKKTFFVGEGIDILRDSLIEKLGDKAIFAESFQNIPLPSIVAIMGLENAKRGAFISARELHPVYLRKSEAEIKFG